MDLDEKLSKAFSAWSDARFQLAALRTEASHLVGHGQQLAQTPEAAAVFGRIGEQERACEALFASLLAVADERAQQLEIRTAPPRAPDPRDA